MGIEYMSVTDVAKRLGISTAAASAYKLPQPDATIGRTRGWLPEAADVHAKTRTNNNIPRPPTYRERRGLLSHS